MLQLISATGQQTVDAVSYTHLDVYKRQLLYLSNQAAKAGSKSFRIPFDRQGLADHLNLDRSALSKELGKMRDEGILETTKNEFTLHELPE